MQVSTKVRYTYPKDGRTYAQAWVDGRWQHVITVSAKESASHQAIVTHVGRQLEKGELTFSEAKAKKHELKAAGFVGF